MSSVPTHRADSTPPRTPNGENQPAATESTPSPWSQIGRPHLWVGLGLIVLYGGFRAWALFRGWFYGDDFTLIDQGRSELSFEYLFEPHSIHLMPTGRFLAWLTGHNGGLDWPLVATTTLIMQLLVALACFWMLLTLFGERWAVIGLLTIFLTSAIAVPATMWWAAAINQLPHQFALCLAVGAWVRYARSRHLGWLAAAVAAVTFGLLAYVKSSLILIVLAYLLIAYFTTGGPVDRARMALRRNWPALAAFGVLGLGYVATYVSTVRDVSASLLSVNPGDLIDTMVVESLGTGLVGGPWRWDRLNPPASLVDAPLWGVVLAWAALLGGVCWLWLTRVRTLRSWGLFAMFVSVSFMLLYFSRASGFGAIAGLELRYSTDVAIMFPLCIGLAALELHGAAEYAEERGPALVTLKVPRRLPVAALTIIAALGLWSSTTYVLTWQNDNPARSYADNLRSGVQPGDDLVDRALPPFMFSGDLRLSTLVGQLGLDVDYPEISDSLLVVDDSGNVLRPIIDPVSQGVEGSRSGCGWSVRSGDPQQIPLNQTAGNWDWWARLGILASTESRVSVTAAGVTHQAVIQPGVSSLYVHVVGEVDEISVAVDTPGAAVCVDDLQLGNLVGGQPR